MRSAPTQIGGSADGALSLDSNERTQARQTDGLGFFREGTRHEHAGAGGGARGPVMGKTDQRRDAGVEERSVFVVDIEPSTAGQGHGLSDDVIILDEDSRNQIGVIESLYLV